MTVKAERRKTARKLVCQDLYPMVKDTLRELQSPVEAHQLGEKQRPIPEVGSKNWTTSYGA